MTLKMLYIIYCVVVDVNMKQSVCVKVNVCVCVCICMCKYLFTHIYVSVILWKKRGEDVVCLCGCVGFFSTENV